MLLEGYLKFITFRGFFGDLSMAQPA